MNTSVVAILPVAGILFIGASPRRGHAAGHVAGAVRRHGGRHLLLDLHRDAAPGDAEGAGARDTGRIGKGAWPAPGRRVEAARPRRLVTRVHPGDRHSSGRADATQEMQPQKARARPPRTRQPVGGPRPDEAEHDVDLAAPDPATGSATSPTTRSPAWCSRTSRPLLADPDAFAAVVATSSRGRPARHRQGRRAWRRAGSSSPPRSPTAPVPASCRSQGRQAARRQLERPTRWSTAPPPSRSTADAFAPGDRVLVVDDVLATGGTAAATVDLVRRAGARGRRLSRADRADLPGGPERLPDVDRRAPCVDRLTEARGGRRTIRVG